MSSRKRFFLVFVFIIIDMFIIIGYLVIKDATMLNKLRNEVEVVSELNLGTDRYNTKIKCSSNYGVVESAIKSYLDNYSVSLQSELKVIKNPKLTTILSYDNYKEDGPGFSNSIKYLDETKKKFNNSIDKLTTGLERDTIMKYGREHISDTYSLGLYEELMFSEEMLNNFEGTKELLFNTRIKVNSIFDNSKEVLKYLNKNKDDWKLEDGEIQFISQEKYDQYDKLISKVKTEKEE